MRRADEYGTRAPQATRTREPGVETRQRDPAQGGGFFRPGGARPPTEVMVSFIDQHRAEYGVEPICEQLPISPATLSIAKTSSPSIFISLQSWAESLLL